MMLLYKINYFTIHIQFDYFPPQKKKINKNGIRLLI